MTTETIPTLAPNPRLTGCTENNHGYPAGLDTLRIDYLKLGGRVAVCDCGTARWVWVVTERGSYGWSSR